MYFTADREGRIWEEDSFQDKFLEWMYSHTAGRMFIKPFIRREVSVLGGRLLDLSISRALIPFFIKGHAISMEEYEEESYASYNDFFKRRLRDGARTIEMDADVFISPCDSRLSVYRLGKDRRFSVKHADYTAESLLRDKKLARRYAGGYVWIFRLRVEDCHRYIYIDNGKEILRRKIPGVFHTVNPAAGGRLPVYKENTREYCLLRTENFGDVIQMEVGALLVGRIENRPGKECVRRGQEKGNFAFGGSTVLLLTQPGRVCPDRDILENTKHGIETKVKLGERTGKRAVTV